MKVVWICCANLVRGAVPPYQMQAFALFGFCRGQFYAIIDIVILIIIGKTADKCYQQGWVDGSYLEFSQERDFYGNY